MEWGAKGDNNGKWKVASDICGTKLMLQAVSGGVSCFGGQALSNFGCRRKEDMAVYVTDGKGYENVIVPFNITKKGVFYNLPGYSSDSPYIVFDLPLFNETEYCFNNATEYELWYGEDMLDKSEADNHGTAYTDIYIDEIGKNTKVKETDQQLYRTCADEESGECIMSNTYCGAVFKDSKDIAKFFDSLKYINCDDVEKMWPDPPRDNT